jgi:hypothetical protein
MVLHNEEVNDINTSPHIIGMIISFENETGRAT